MFTRVVLLAGSASLIVTAVWVVTPGNEVDSGTGPRGTIRAETEGAPAGSPAAELLGNGRTTHVPTAETWLTEVQGNI